jgi:hypothetical protein
VLASLVEVTRAIAVPVLANVLYDLGARAYAAGDALEQLAGQLARAGRAAAAPVPPRPEVVQLDRVIGIGDLLQIAQDEGRVVYAP